ncbi:MAG: ATP-dependent RecD-like DNA helicase [Desulfobulbaceae bacterium]|nr:ATP-dependent RecD-like DNA helicase [Desulfobulbaceae bacterium]
MNQSKQLSASISPASADQTRLAGVLEKITFQNPDNGFTVARLQLLDGAAEAVTVVGTLSGVGVGTSLALFGQWRQDTRHGKQFQLSSYLVMQPDTLKGIEKYLGSGMIKGIGPSYAARIVAHFGLETLAVLEQAPERLREVAGLGRKRLEGIVQAWRQHRDLHEIMVFLQGHDIPAAQAVKIYQTYGREALAVVRQNPYRLAEDIWGIGFRSADRIALALEMSPRDPRRARAGMLYVLEEAAAAGHCYLDRADLLQQCAVLLGCGAELVEAELPKLVGDEKLVVSWEQVYLAPLFHAEAGAAVGILRLQGGVPPWGGLMVARELPGIQDQLGLKLAAEQEEALQTALGGRMAIITGGPGTGKSTILKALILLLEGKGMSLALAAPTGRAAKRLADATGREAKTIHRLLEYDPAGSGFRRNAENVLAADLVVVDEASMLDIYLTYALLRALPPGAGLLLVGDYDQLPSVGPGNVLRELIATGIFPVARLTKIFRQGAGSLISLNAGRINRGESFELLPDYRGEKDFYYICRENDREIETELLSLCGGRLGKKYDFDPRHDIQVLTPMRKGLLGLENLNLRLQKLFAPGDIDGPGRGVGGFLAGDKVMQLRNNYDKDVFNGDIGFVVRIEAEEEVLLVDYDGHQVVYGAADRHELQLAYAITVHKSQGSEFPCVIIPLHTSHYALLQRNLLYTALTRGRKLVVVIGSRRAVALAIANSRIQERHSGLRRRILAGCGLAAPDSVPPPKLAKPRP